MTSLNYRQVHLDFHTSGLIEGIGKDFNKRQFQDMLKRGHINSITLFSKCHHGWAYHPSRANEQHPYLAFDLLKEQIEAAHEIGVKTPVYLSAGLDEKLTRRHPEWLARLKTDSTLWPSDFNQPGYHLFCFNSPYLDILIRQIEEIVSKYDADGIFLDIVKPSPCYCHNCVNTLLAEGKDPYDDDNAMVLAEKIYANYTKRVRLAIDKFKPGLPVFHNGGHISKGRSDLAHMNTHLEMESLPTGGWGYDHFPASAKYVMTKDQDYLGMTGKFHTTWGEFGGFKHPNALIYETSLSIAMGGKCSIGDQLHPYGQMDPLTYDIIGKAYSLVEEKEAWCDNVQNIADIAILSAESLNTKTKVDPKGTYLMDVGANRMLLQSHYLYEIIDGDTDFSKYKVIILSDNIRLDENMTEKIQTYLEQGGKLLATGESCLSIDQNSFTVDLGVEWLGRCENTPNYFRPESTIGPFLPTSIVMYSPSEEVAVTSGKVIGHMEKSFFNRKTFSFCSHQHAPSTMTSNSPGMVQTDNTIYIPWKVFTEFAEIGSLHLREMVVHALDLLLDSNKTLTTNLPSQGIVSYMNQAGQNRKILHLLYASPVYRGFSKFTNLPIEVIEDLVPIHNTNIDLKVSAPVKNVYLAPQMTNVNYQQNNDILSFNIKEFTCHQMIVIE